MLDFNQPEELIGGVLDRRWRLMRVLGQGGLGVVFEAAPVEGQGSFAIKVLRSEFAESEEIVTRFLNEVSASSRIDDPGVARVFEAVRAADGTPYLVMEMLTGQTLARRMNKGRVPVEQATAIIRNILRTLAVAHAAGVIHRDLKPGNIFQVGDVVHGSDVKVLDFGIALVVDAAGGMQRKTRTGMMLGTPGYMSPEQIRDVKHADARADLWAVGVIFHELLTGAPAFEAENEFSRVTKVLTSEPVPIEKVAPQYAHWGPFFRRALSRDPAQRFQTAVEMSHALESVARSGQMPATPHISQAPAWSGPAQPVASGEHYVSAPPPTGPVFPSSPPATPELRRFGGDTALSAGLAMGAGRSVPPPSVPLVVMIGVIGVLMGFVVGIVVGKW
jgi:serine/threonine-protein kinase